MSTLQSWYANGSLYRKVPLLSCRKRLRWSRVLSRLPAVHCAKYGTAVHLVEQFSGRNVCKMHELGWYSHGNRINLAICQIIYLIVKGIQEPDARRQPLGRHPAIMCGRVRVTRQMPISSSLWRSTKDFEAEAPYPSPFSWIA